MSKKQHKAKITKSGKVSITLPAEDWEIIYRAMLFRSSQAEGEDVATWWLIREAIEQLEEPRETQQMRKSIFHIIFHAATFQHVDDSFALLMNQILDPLSKQLRLIRKEIIQTENKIITKEND